MSSTDCLRLFVLCFWLLVGDVNCENTQRGYVLRVQAGQAPVGVYNDNGDHKRQSETSIFRRPSAGYRMPSLHRGQSGYVYPAEQQHTIDSKSSQIQSHYPAVPETQNSNVNHFESRKTLVYSRPGHKTLPDTRKIQQARSDSRFATGAAQFSPHMYHVRPKSTERFSPVQVDGTPVTWNSHSGAVSPDIQAVKHSVKSESQKFDATPTRPHVQSPLATRPEVSGYQSAHLFHNTFIHDKTSLLPKGSKPINKNVDSTVKGSNSGDKVGTPRFYPTWSPRVNSDDATSEAKGYANVRRLKPGFDKVGPHASSAAGKKSPATGFPSLNQNQGSYNHDSRKLGFGPGVPVSSGRQQNVNQVSRGNQPSSWHPSPSDRTQNLVQGKFKPFQRLPTDDFPVPSLNSTNNTITEMRNESTSPMQTEALDKELLLSESILEGQSVVSEEVGPSFDENEPLPDFPLKVQLTEDDGEGDMVSNPPETDQPDSTTANVNDDTS